MKSRHFIYLLCILLLSCNIKRSLVAESSGLRTDSSHVTSVDTTRVSDDKQQHVTNERIETDTSYSVTADFDSLGNITRLVYMFRINELLNTHVENSSQKLDWLYGLSTITSSSSEQEQRDYLNDNIAQKNKIGVWVWFSIATVVVLGLLFLSLKFKIWQ